MREWVRIARKQEEVRGVCGDFLWAGLDDQYRGRGTVLWELFLEVEPAYGAGDEVRRTFGSLSLS